HELAPLAYHNPRVVYSLLFQAAAATLQTIAGDPNHLGAQLGFLAILHTWSQTLLYHPHLHCVVPGGGLAPDGARWIACRPVFFLPVRVLSRLFRRLFLAALQEAFAHQQLQFFADVPTSLIPRPLPTIWPRCSDATGSSTLQPRLGALPKSWTI